MARERFKPHVEVHRNVVCQSARPTPVQFKMITIHDTESFNVKGLADLVSVGDHFDVLATQASATVGVDNEGNSARYVPDMRKAWSVAFYNPWQLSIEHIGFAFREPVEYTDLQYREGARWIAYWSYHHGIPIRKGRVSVDGRILTSGVFRHSELGRLGGGHSDPGAHFDLNKQLTYARHYLQLFKSHGSVSH